MRDPESLHFFEQLDPDRKRIPCSRSLNTRAVTFTKRNLRSSKSTLVTDTTLVLWLTRLLWPNVKAPWCRFLWRPPIPEIASSDWNPWYQCLLRVVVDHYMKYLPQIKKNNLERQIRASGRVVRFHVEIFSCYTITTNQTNWIKE